MEVREEEDIHLPNITTILSRNLEGQGLKPQDSDFLPLDTEQSLT